MTGGDVASPFECESARRTARRRVVDPVAPAVTVVLRVLNRAEMPLIAVVAEGAVIAVSRDLSVVGAVPLLSKFRLRLCR